MSNSVNRPIRAGTTAAAIAVAALTAGSANAAAPSSHTESRGYQACVAAAAHDLHLIKMNEHYYIYDHADSRRYYLNGYAFRNGDPQAVKVSCDTTRSGGRVLDLAVDGGHYAGQVATPVNVAEN